MAAFCSKLHIGRHLEDLPVVGCPTNEEIEEMERRVQQRITFGARDRRNAAMLVASWALDHDEFRIASLAYEYACTECVM